MKRMALVVLLLSGLVVAGCGGSSSSTDCTTGEAAAQSSFDDFSTLLENDDIQPCLDASGTCDCPGGGSLTMDMAALTLTLDSCISAAGKTYDGEIDAAADLSSISGTINPFGDCTNITATDIVIEGECGGTITLTCGGQTLNCSISDDGAGDCDLTCTC